jgi:hypothetical protein
LAVDWGGLTQALMVAGGIVGALVLLRDAAEILIGAV